MARKTGKRRYYSDAAMAVAVRGARAVGDLGCQRPPSRGYFAAMAKVPWRQERNAEFHASTERTHSLATHKPSDRPLIAARLRREAEAAAWIERVKARKAKG